MEKRAEDIFLIDNLRSQDSKQRLKSVECLKMIATEIGPVKTRTDLMEYLMEFIDDEQSIVLQLLNQLQDFSCVLGGEQHEKALLPLLIGFCKTDQKKEAEKASYIIEGILLKDKSLILDTVKMLDETEMITSKESSAKLISSLIQLLPQSENQMIKIYSTLIYNNLSPYRIIASKYLTRLLHNIKNKQHVGKMIEFLYSEMDDLPKIFAFQALINYYSVNPVSSLSILKGLMVLNNWRINIKICEHVSTAAKIFNKVHFKTAFESNLLKFLDSPEPQLRAKACEILRILALMMSEEDIKKILVPIIKKLSIDQYDFVKVKLSQNIISLVEVCSGTFLQNQILPVIFTFIKSNDFTVGMVQNINTMTKKLRPQVLEQKLLNPLINKLQKQNWKMKCRMLQLLEDVVTDKDFLNEKMIITFVNLVSDRIYAVRQRSTYLIIKIIHEQPSKWCDEMIMPKLMNLKNNQSYNVRQELLEIIEKTEKYASEKTLNQFYKQVLLTGLVDKVSNVRAKALKTVKFSQKLFDKIMEKNVQKLKDDTDQYVKELALEMVKT